MSDPIFVSFTDEDGVGPDVVALTLELWPSPALAAELALPLRVIIRAAACEQYDTRIRYAIGGAFTIDVESARKLHEQIGVWLGAHDGGSQ